MLLAHTYTNTPLAHCQEGTQRWRGQRAALIHHATHKADMCKRTQADICKGNTGAHLQAQHELTPASAAQAHIHKHTCGHPRLWRRSSTKASAPAPAPAPEQLLQQAQALALSSTTLDDDAPSLRAPTALRPPSPAPAQALLNARTCAALCATLLTMASAASAVAAASGSASGAQAGNGGDGDSNDSSSAGSSTGGSGAGDGGAAEVDGIPAAGPSVQAWAPAARAWEEFEARAQMAMDLWDGLGQDLVRLGEDHVSALVWMLVHWCARAHAHARVYALELRLYACNFGHSKEMTPPSLSA